MYAAFTIRCTQGSGLRNNIHTSLTYGGIKIFFDRFAAQERRMAGIVGARLEEISHRPSGACAIAFQILQTVLNQFSHVL